MEALIGLIVLAGFAVWIYALVDAIKVKDDSRFRAGNKLVWVLVIVFLHLIGAIVYLIVGRPGPEARPSSPTPPEGSLPPPPPPS